MQRTHHGRLLRIAVKPQLADCSTQLVCVKRLHQIVESVVLYRLHCIFVVSRGEDHERLWHHLAERFKHVTVGKSDVGKDKVIVVVGGKLLCHLRHTFQRSMHVYRVVNIHNEPFQTSCAEMVVFYNQNLFHRSSIVLVL